MWASHVRGGIIGAGLLMQTETRVQVSKSKPGARGRVPLWRPRTIESAWPDPGPGAVTWRLAAPGQGRPTYG